MTLPGLDLGILRAYLLGEEIGVEGELRATPFSHGRSNLTYLVEDDATRWVLRRPPTAGLTPSAHAVDREFRVTAALAGSRVPVAEAIRLCRDVDVMGSMFTLSGFVDGRTLNTQDDLKTLTDAELSELLVQLMATLADLHTVDPEAIGLSDFGRPGYVERQTRLWFRQWGLAKAASTSLRMAGADQMVEAYLSRSGLDLGDWDFYLAFAYFKIAVIAQGIHHRYRLGAASGPGHDTEGDSVPELLSAAEALLARP